MSDPGRGPVHRTRGPGAVLALALLVTGYWTVIGIFMIYSWGSILALFGGGCVFVLLVWALQDGGEGKPRLSTYVVTTASAAYTYFAVLGVGLLAYIEGHGCALEPETCDGSGPSLMARAALIAIGIYLLAAILVIAWGARSKRVSMHTTAGGAGNGC